MSLQIKGINYDIGTYFAESQSSRPDFDPEIVKQEMAIIAHQLHCNTVRISGYDINRLILAAEYAIQNGMAVWLSPTLINARPEALLPYLSRCAKQATPLLQKGDVTLVVGCEWTIFTDGLLPGRNMPERVKYMTSPLLIPKILARVISGRNPRPEVAGLNSLLARAVKAVRVDFPGKLTYAAGEWEEIDWQPFDIVSVDYYRAKQSRAAYVSKLAAFKSYGKPVAVTEFGCCAFLGADKLGGAGWQVIDWHVAKPTLKPGITRDEQVQANYLKKQLDIFAEQRILGAFVYTFINPTQIYSSNPAEDFDMASYGIVKPVAPEETRLGKVSWEPKAAFEILADYYK